MSHFVIIGAGPVGRSATHELIEAGHTVSMVTRRGTGPDEAKLIRADASNASEITRIANGATAIVNCANPPYTSWPKEWPPIANALLSAAGTTGAALITMSNLYAHGPSHQTMTAQTPFDAKGSKGRVRAKMWTDALALHEAGRVNVAEVRASDFFGPEVRDANLGERVIAPMIHRQKRARVQLLGRIDVAHSFSFIPDVGRVLARVANEPSAWGRAWLVPSTTLTQQQMVNAFAIAAGKPSPKISTMPTILLKTLGIFMPVLRELPEVLYQFEAPFVVDATETTDTFSIDATPINEALHQTVAWWKTQSR
jgi:nucleoside-diphosphate-sugar epimerase